MVIWVVVRPQALSVLRSVHLGIGILRPARASNVLGGRIRDRDGRLSLRTAKSYVWEGESPAHFDIAKPAVLRTWKFWVASLPPNASQ